MKILVDADACPAVIKAIVVKAAMKRKIKTIFVANKPIYLQTSIYLAAVQVEQGMDVADQYIVKHATAGDLVITQDIPLAAQLVPQKVVVMSVHGTLFTSMNMGERLAIRDFMQEIRDGGGQTKGPKPFSQKDKQNFAHVFDQQLAKCCKSNNNLTDI